MSATTSNKQKPKGRKKSRLSGKTNDCGGESKEDSIQTTLITPMGIVEQPETEKEGRGQDEEFAVPCSQKIVPTFRKQKRAAKKMCQNENDIPKKRLKAVDGCKTKSNNTVTNVQLHNQDKSTYGPSTNTTNTGQLIKDQSDQSNTEQTVGSLTNLVKPKLESVTVTQDQGEQVEPTVSLQIAMQVTEAKEQNKDLTNKDLPQVKFNRMKDQNLQGNQQLNTELDVIATTINSISGEQFESDNKEPLNRCHNDMKCYDNINEKTEDTVKKPEEHGIIQDNETNPCGLQSEVPGAETPTNPEGHPIDINLKSKEESTEEHICDGHYAKNSGCIVISQMATENHSKILNKDMGMIEDIKSHGRDQEVKINTENQGQWLLLTNDTTKALMCTTDQISKPSMPSIPTLQAITTRVLEQHKEKVEANQDSYCILGHKLTATGSKEDPEKDNCKTLGTMKFCDLGTRKDIPTENNTEKNTKDTGVEADVIPKRTIDRSSKTSNLIWDQTTLEELEAKTHGMTTVEGVEAKTHDMTTVEGLEAKTHNMTTIEGMEAVTHNTTTVEGLEAETHGMTTVEGMEAKTHHMTTVEGMEAKIHNMTTVEGLEAKRHDMTIVEDVEAETHGMTTVDDNETETHDMTRVEGVEVQTDGKNTVESVEAEEISDSQMCAITTMDWTEEPLGPSGDTGRGHDSKPPVPSPSIPDGTAIVKGLIREVSNLNTMLLRAKREMQTANQSKPQTLTKTWAKK